MKKQETKKMLQTILRTIYESNLNGEDLPEDLPQTSLAFLAYHEDIEAFLSEEVLPEEFDEQARIIANDEGYYYEQIYQLMLANKFSEKRLAHFHDNGDKVSNLLHELVCIDMQKPHYIKEHGTHYEVLLLMNQHGAFFEMWDEVFHALIQDYFSMV